MWRVVGLAAAVSGCRIGFSELTDVRDGPMIDSAADSTAADGASDSTSGCAGYVMWSGFTSAYRVVTTDTAWDAAETACEADGAHLAVIDSTAENREARMRAGGDCWIGASDRVTEGTFRTVTGNAPPYSAWPVMAPANTSEDCVFLLTSAAQWEDQACATGLRFVCECDGVPADPASY